MYGAAGTATGYHPTQIDPMTVLLDEKVDEPLDLQAGDSRGRSRSSSPCQTTLCRPCSAPLHPSVFLHHLLERGGRRHPRLLSPGEKGNGKSAINLGINVYNAPVTRSRTVTSIDPGSNPD